jgi:hypothetical protein
MDQEGLRFRQGGNRENRRRGRPDAVPQRPPVVAARLQAKPPRLVGRPQLEARPLMLPT